MTESGTIQRHGEAERPENSEDGILAVAHNYADAFPGADILAIETHLELVRAHLDAVAVGAKYIRLRTEVVSPPQYAVLRALYLAPNGYLTQSQLAGELQTSRGNVTQLMDGLEQKGLAEREVSPGSRRVTHARLTPKGLAEAKTLVPAMVSFMEQTCSTLSDEEKQQLRDLLIKYRAGVRTIEVD